jgi:aminobenzoyl-glutamate utilization protein B
MRLFLFRVVLIALFVRPQPSPINDYKAVVAADVNAMAKQSQVMVDMVFSFGELGFQEVETSP